jgi:branched-chain amino acid transport system ATP-binding protein
MTSLALDHVSKRFGGVVAADAITLEIPAGRITGMIGPNGAGKTTIVNLITGMLTSDSGRVLFGDRNISGASPSDVCRAGLARTFQNIRLLAEATVLENVMIGFHRFETSSLLASLLGLPAARRETRSLQQKASALIDSFGMSRYAGFAAGGLSYGHQRRVEIMRALASSPSILLLDEPVAGMNDAEADALGTVFRTLAETGTGIFLIEHNLRFVTGLCEHVYVLDGGRLIAQGTPQTVVADPAVVAAYIGE